MCGYNKSMRSLHFHHKDPSKKDFGISRVTLKWDKIKPELDKCILLCSNCQTAMVKYTMGFIKLI